MDAKYSGEMLKHLEKQNELLMDAYRSMSHELHKLQVEEEMLMRKFYELMSAQGFTKKDGVGRDASGNNRTGDSTALVIKDGDAGNNRTGDSTALVIKDGDEQQSG